MEWFIVDNLIKACKIIFSEYRLPNKRVSDAGTNFIPEDITGELLQNCNWHIKACVKCMKRTMKDAKLILTYICLYYMSLLKIGSTPIGPRLLSVATFLFNRSPRVLMQRFSRPPIMCDNDENILQYQANNPSWIFSAYRINFKSTVRRQGTMYAWNSNWTWIRRAQWEMLHYQSGETKHIINRCKWHIVAIPHICGRLLGMRWWKSTNPRQITSCMNSDRFAKMHNSEYLNKKELERKDTDARVIPQQELGM